MNPLKSILNQIFGSFSGGEKSVVGIDIGSSFIKIVQLRKKGERAVLETYGSISLGPYDNTTAGHVTNLSLDKIVSALSDLIKESNVTTKISALTMSSNASLIFVIRLPGSVDLAKLSSIVPIEARKYIPVPIDEVSLDWFLVPKDSDFSRDFSSQSKSGDLKAEESEILVTATHSDAVKKYQDIVSKAGLQAEDFEIEVFSDARSSLKHELSSVAILNIGASKTRLAILERGVVKSFHIINRGSMDMTNEIMISLGVSFEKAEELKTQNHKSSSDDKSDDISEIIKPTLDYIFSETANSIFSYEKNHNKTVSRVILSGGGSLMKGIESVALSKLNIDVSLSDPFSKIEAPPFLSETLKEIGPQFSIALGVALRKLS